jgi:hypothetical protein
MRSNFFASVDVMEFQTTEAYSTLGRTSVKYSININIIIIIIIIMSVGRSRKFKSDYTINIIYI